MFPSEAGILHLVVDYFFRLLILCMIVRVFLSWLPIPQGHPVVRFFANVTSPVIEPIARRIPRASMGFLDLSLTIGFIFAFWVIWTLNSLIQLALPPNW